MSEKYLTPLIPFTPCQPGAGGVEAVSGEGLRTFPPPCRICEIFASINGMELGKALTLMKRAMQGECVCTLGMGHHGALHPHTAPVVGCLGVQMREVPHV